MPRDRLRSEVDGKAGAITLLTDRVDCEFLDAAGPQFKIVANCAAGFDNIDLGACTRHGVLACNTPGVLTETTADAAFALMMAAALSNLRALDRPGELKAPEYLPQNKGTNAPISFACRMSAGLTADAVIVADDDSISDAAPA
jgi:phosphoglycerate dehydrogenase-like enzyme